MQFDLRTMAEHMGGVAWAVVIVLFIMSMYSIAVMIERFWTFRQATLQSRKYVPEVARYMKSNKIHEAINVSDGKQYRLSHLAKVLKPGLQEWQYQVETGEVERDRDAAVEAAKRAIHRATAVNLADLKRGLSGLATIGATAPFVGLFGTTFGIINAFSGMALTGSGGIAAISAGIAEALITTAFGLFVAVPGGVGLQLLQRQGRELQRRDGQRQLGAARPVHQEGLAQRGAGRADGHERSHPMSMAVGGSKGGPMANINVTPMADIMIVLLIIFMVITPLLQKGVDVVLPKAGNTKERKDEPKSIVVAIKKDSTTYLSGQKLDNQAELLPKVKEKLQDLPEGARMIYLKADDALAYSEVMKVMDLVREAGAEEVALIAEPRVQG